MVYCLKFMKGDSSLKPSIKVSEKSVTKAINTNDYLLTTFLSWGFGLLLLV